MPGPIVNLKLRVILISRLSATADMVMGCMGLPMTLVRLCWVENSSSIEWVQFRLVRQTAIFPMFKL